MDAEGTTPQKPVLAVFDFDGTLTFADSMIPFLREIAGAARFWGGVPALLPTLCAFKLGRIDNKTAKEAFFNKFLSGRQPGDLEPVVRRFLAGRLARLVNPTAMEHLRRHQEQGHRVVVVSASPELYLLAWASCSGIREAIGTRLEVRDGALTGRIEGANCHGSEKVARLEEALGPLSRFTVHAYGDSSGDAELLAAAQHPSYRQLGCHGPLGWLWRMLAFLRALL
jgi:HAD superfamily hydrolase (TIGR01490 family)